MLKGIPAILPPELLKVLCEMGHGDEITIGDANFPGARLSDRVIRMDGHGVPEILDAILTLIPLDQYVERPAALMQVVPGDTVETPIWEVYHDLCDKAEGKEVQFEHVERFAFYERAKKAYCVVMTGETALYANIILKKGVVVEK